MNTAAKLIGKGLGSIALLIAASLFAVSGLGLCPIFRTGGMRFDSSGAFLQPVSEC